MPGSNHLKQMFNPPKTTYANLELIDFVGITLDQEPKQIFLLIRTRPHQECGCPGHGPQKLS